MKKIIMAAICIVNTPLFASEMLLDEPPTSERRTGLLSSLGSLVEVMDERISSPDHAKEVFNELGPAQAALDAVIGTFNWSQDTLPQLEATTIKYRLNLIQEKGIAELDSWTYNLYNFLPFYNQMDSSSQEAFIAQLILYTDFFNTITTSSHMLSAEQEQKIMAIRARLGHIRLALGFEIV